MYSNEFSGEIPQIDYMDTLVPVEFVTQNGEVSQHLFPTEDARDPKFVLRLAEAIMKCPANQVVIYVGYSSSEGGTT